MDLGAKYQVIKELGAGAMGRVFKARQVLLKRVVAIKVINNALVQSEESRRRFIREAQLSAQLSHPNIVKTYDVEHTIIDDTPLTFIVSEFIDGFPLGNLLKKTPVPAIKTTIRLVAQLLEGLAHAHSKKVIHRDIKPDNLLVTKEGQIKIADFGIARTTESNSTLTKEGVIIGTPLFLAPELIAPKPGQTITKAVDLYATGVLLYRMLTGKYPFIANDAATLLHKHLNEKAIKPSMHNPDVPAHLSRLTMQLLAKDPNARPQSAKEVAQELRRAPRADDLDASSSSMTVFEKSSRNDNGATITNAPEVTSTASLKEIESKASTNATALNQASRPKSIATPRGSSDKTTSPQSKVKWPVAFVFFLIGIFVLYKLWPSSLPAFEKARVRTERIEPQRATFTWQSKVPYRAKFVAKAINGNYKAKKEEKKARTEHTIIFDDIRTKYNYRYVISADSVELATGVLLGRPATVDEVYVYQRRGVADIDWVTQLPIKNPRVVEVKRNRSFIAQRKKRLPDGRFLYSALIEQKQPSPRSYRFTGVTSSPIVKSVQCVNEVIATSTERPTVEMKCMRYIDARLSASEHKVFYNSMSPKHQPKLLGDRDRIRARYDTEPIIAGDEMLVSHRAGEVIAYERPGPSSFRWPRPKKVLVERWAFRDHVENYDGASAMSVDGDKVMFLQNRHPLHIHSGWWGIKRKSIADKVNKLAIEAVNSLVKDKKVCKFDNVYVLNRKKRYEQYQQLVKEQSREKFLTNSKLQAVNPNWEERSFKFLCPSSEQTKPHIWFDGGVDWTFSPKVGKLYCRLYNQHPEPADISAILDIKDKSAKYCRLLKADMNYVLQPPVILDDVVYFLSIPERQKKLKNIMKDNRPNFLYAFSTIEVKKRWTRQIDNSIELSRLYYDMQKQRMYVASQRDIHIIDCHGRNNYKSPKDFKISIEAARRAMARNKDIPNLYGLCFASTPITFASAEDRKKKIEYILVSVGIESKNRDYHEGFLQEATATGLVIFQVNERYEILKAIAVEKVGHTDASHFGKAAGSTEHIVKMDEVSGLTLFVLNNHVLVIDPNKSPPNHLVLETQQPGNEVEFVTFDRNAIYFTIRRGQILRASYSPTRRGN